MVGPFVIFLRESIKKSGARFLIERYISDSLLAVLFIKTINRSPADIVVLGNFNVAASRRLKISNQILDILLGQFGLGAKSRNNPLACQW
jgi:hypothetical protein